MESSFRHMRSYSADDEDPDLYNIKSTDNNNNSQTNINNQSSQDQQDITSDDSISKLHKSIENATKVYQRLLKEKNINVSPNISLGLKLLDHTLNLISLSSEHSPVHPGYNQVLNILNNPNDISSSSSNNSGSNGIDNEQQVDEALVVSEKIEIGLVDLLKIVNQQSNHIKLLMKQVNPSVVLTNTSTAENYLTNNASVAAASLTTATTTTNSSLLTTSTATSTQTSSSLAPTSSSTTTTSVISPNIQSVPYPNGFGLDEPISLQRGTSSVSLLKGIDLAPVVIGSVDNKFPKFLIAEPKNDSFIFTINGPSSDQLESSVHACFNNNFFAKTVSTYPHLPGHPKRDGDPICDHFCIQMQSNRVIAAIADGCNWGTRPAEAALKASTSFVDFISKALSSEIQTVQDAGNHILSAFNYAHNKIIEEKTDIWDAGTTTLLGGVMVELIGNNDFNNNTNNNNNSNPTNNQIPSTSTPPTPSATSNPPSPTLSKLPSSLPSSPLSSTPPSPLIPSENLSNTLPTISNNNNNNNNNNNLLSRSAPTRSNNRDTLSTKWGFICASVGDCKVFHYNHANKKFTDITKNNRGNVDDPKDPGGRLGPYVANGHPDLRNLCLHFLPCQENDIIILVSDGVHDNLDPQTIGVTPRECQLPYDHWSDMETEKIQECKSKYMQEFLKKRLLNAAAIQHHQQQQLLQQQQPHHHVQQEEWTLTPKTIVEKLIEHCVETTRSSREFMVNSPNKPLPDDLKLYPGKMDHSTCVAFRVDN
ncbi:hypothetical protein PPL_10313 [Heterostelium album PN500]|uniref:PPM-type phosphatase domain-containing protein n=1 Tax=Heterostelium pallidum (strain ATCC 26659 / Pp 5 / PN500) TaxID=670386 RepID=D3BPZ4_HETP5|nr:hypothetical protein PPL_10313 [Heterostelium album PN500]EFA76545.1 hypothetical protein PPL_10313 [Heterostelium album PN500]|eukprot:XP_020428677.1 hypothetical protein PPL_10313 [Heterostelium album PN500]